MFSRRTVQVVVARRQVCIGNDSCTTPFPPSPMGASSASTSNGTMELVSPVTPSASSSSAGSTMDPSTITTVNSTTPSSSTASGDAPSATSPSSNPTSSTSATQTTNPITLAPSSTASRSPTVDATSTTSNAGTIAGSVVGGVIFLVLVALALLLYLRARKRKRTPPSSEFINALKAGTTPVLRLDSGAEYTPGIPEKGGGYTHYPPPIPLPFMQNSYYSSPPTGDMKFPNEMMLAGISSGRPSADEPLRPQRFSIQATNESFVAQHHVSSSIGSGGELWGSEPEVHASDLSPVRLSPTRADSLLHFASHFSMDEPLSQSPPSLHPLRRQPN